MPCPHLKEVVMLYCDAYPVKKMVPLDRLVSVEPCIARDFRDCPLFGHAEATEAITEEDRGPIAGLHPAAPRGAR
jgi:hypothetical protein